ncbi:MAG: DNA-binding protein [bacterium]
MPTVDWDDHMVAKLKENPEHAPGYLNACIEEGTEAFKIGLKHVVDAFGGATEISKKSGISRETIYKAFRSNGNPTLNSLHSLLSATGMRLNISKIGSMATASEPADKKRTSAK